jgi:hypothetical protein
VKGFIQSFRIFSILASLTKRRRYGAASTKLRHNLGERSPVRTYPSVKVKRRHEKGFIVIRCGDGRGGAISGFRFHTSSVPRSAPRRVLGPVGKALFLIWLNLPNPSKSSERREIRFSEPPRGHF